jgi:hypothetical protein
MTGMDIFATASEVAEIKKEKPGPEAYGHVYNGRYWLPDVTDPAAWVPGSYGAKSMPRGYMRCSNLIGAYSELRALMHWEEEMIMIGLCDRPDIVAQLSVLERDEEGRLAYSDARNIAQQALQAAKADRWSIIGTAYHKALEIRLATGRLVGTQEIRDGILALEAHMRSALLRPEPSLAERTVVNAKVGVAGRFDVPVWDLRDGPAVLRMADLKTKRKQFWSVLEQRAQLAVYANSDGMWDPQLMCYVPMPRFELDWGVILHLPQGGGQLDLLRMDLDAGWKTALRAREVVDDRAGAKSAPMLRSLSIAPVPLNTRDAILRRLSLVETLEEGSQLLAQIEPGAMDEEELSAAIVQAVERISGRQLTSELAVG